MELRRGQVVWVNFEPARGREQAGHRPALVIASDAFLKQADTLAIVVPATTSWREWPNHVRLWGSDLSLEGETYAMTEQPRTITRDRIGKLAGFVDVAVMREVDAWLRDFLGLP